MHLASPTDWTLDVQFSALQDSGSPHVSEFVGPCCQFNWQQTFKRPLQYVRSLKTLKLVDSVLTHARIISPQWPHWCQRHEPHSDVVEITLKKLVFLASFRLRGVLIAPNRKATSHILWRHDMTADAPSPLDFQDGGIVDLILFFFPSMSALAVAYLSLRPTVV